MQFKDTNNQITTTTSAQSTQGTISQNTQAQSMQGLATQSAQAQNMGQSVQSQAAPGQMAGVQQVSQQVQQLRQTLQDLMMNQQYADGEIVSASADLDQQLQNYSRILSDKKQPSMRTF